MQVAGTNFPQSALACHTSLIPMCIHRGDSCSHHRMQAPRAFPFPIQLGPTVHCCARRQPPRTDILVGAAARLVGVFCRCERATLGLAQP
eukprot:3938910-Rhodomonas_salina.3